MHSCDAKAGDAGGHAFQQKGALQSLGNATRVDHVTLGQGHAVAQALPIGAHLGQNGKTRTSRALAHVVRKWAPARR